MQALARQYPDWKAPSEDGRIVIWPEAPDQLRSQTHENQRRLSSADLTLIQQLPLSELRKRMRQFVGHDDAQPLIATGHQTELYHAGVWAKEAMIHSLAQKLNGQAFHIAVDTDGRKHLNLRWPPGVSIPITDDPNLTTAAWSGLLAAPTPARIDEIHRQLSSDAASWNFKPALFEVLASLRRQSLDSPQLPAALTNVMHELDWSLGLRNHVLLAAPMLTSEPFLVFIHDLISHADELAVQYNAALQVYRDATGIRSHMRPMPDLFVGGDEAVEIPVWLDDLSTGKRARPTVFRRGGGWVMELISGESFAFDPNMNGEQGARDLQRWLIAVNHRISPRALTLTMFLRLCLADQFVHGIGGARYDQVTDLLIQSRYKIEAPSFSVTTATLYFPQALNRQRVCVPCVVQEGHRLRHELIGQRKRELVEAIAALPRRSPQRSQRFFQMHTELSKAAETSDRLRQWRQRLAETETHAREDAAMFDRELFYALQPRERLSSLISSYSKIFD